MDDYDKGGHTKYCMMVHIIFAKRASSYNRGKTQGKSPEKNPARNRSNRFSGAGQK